MSDRLSISRRDFLNGVALGVVAGSSLTPLELLAMERESSGVYPPALTGMRGNHPGSFEIAHVVSWNNARWPQPEHQTGDAWDLVVVGGGISGLAAAFLYRRRVGPGARILVLDNHDDFGGHAKRNEFKVGGETLIGYGGSQSLDTPGQYSAIAKKLLTDIGIHTDRFYQYFDQEFFRSRKLERGIYFGRQAYGEDRVLPDIMRGWGGQISADFAQLVENYPLPLESRSALVALMTDHQDLLPGRTRAQKINLLRATSYSDFLRDHAGMPDDVILLFRDTVKGLWGVGWDALSALEGYRRGMPGTLRLGIGELENEPPGRDEPYIFHFPDGNAAIARGLVRQLVPDAVPGRSMEDLVTSRVDYSRLDCHDAQACIRLLSTAVDVRHTADGNEVDVTYIRNGIAERVRGRHVVLACNSNMAPFICTEMPDAQRAAIEYASKVPLVYINVAVRNWQAFEKLGFHGFYAPQAELMHSFGLDFPVSMGGYRFARDTAQPTVIHGTFVPTLPDQGLTARQQHTAGRRRLFEMSFDEFERGIVSQMDGALSGGGFDAERDITAITVNRWPHGYAYEYNDYSDPAGWDRNNGPHVAGRARIGRVSFANSDAEAYAYVDGAIDAAARAVNEQLGGS